MSTAVTPPATAPTAVATSNSIPRRMLVIPRVTKAVCAIDDVAITQTMLVAMATLMGTPKARLSMGTMMMPPPTPSMLPKTPATKATARSAMLYTSDAADDLLCVDLGGRRIIKKKKKKKQIKTARIYAYVKYHKEKQKVL